MPSADRNRILVSLLEEARAELDAGHLSNVDAVLGEAALIDPGDAELRTLRAQMAYDAGDLSDALQHALAALSRSDVADAHWIAARVFEVRGDRDARARHDCEVLRLDRANDLRFGRVAREDVDRLEAMAADMLEALPAPIANAIATVPIVLEARPHAGIVEDGFDPRAVGLFEGASTFDDAPVDRPARIAVFYANLLATCRNDREVEEQLRITLLHEIGHALGLDEAEVEALGLG